MLTYRLSTPYTRARLLLVATLFANATASPVVVNAQGSVDPFAAYVDEALRNNRALIAARLAERSSLADVREARGRLLPAVRFESRASGMNGVPNLGDLLNPAYAALNGISGTDRFPTDLDQTIPPRHEANVRLTQPLFSPGVVANHAVARERHDAERHLVLVAARQLAEDAQLAYLRFASTRRLEEIQASALALVQEQVRVADLLLAAGRATPDAVFRARAELAATTQTLAEARERGAMSARAFNRLLGRPLDAPITEIPDSALARPLTVNADSAVAIALRGREELHAMEAGERAASTAARAATAAFLPTVALALDYGVQGSEPLYHRTTDYRVASLVVSWDMFDGGRRRARRAAAALDVERQRALIRDLADRITLEVRDAHEAAIVARDAIGAADAQLAAAERVLELVQRRFAEGVATPVEFIDARTAFTNAGANRVLTLHRYAAQWISLERAAALRPIDGSLVFTSEKGSPK